MSADFPSSVVPWPIAPRPFFEEAFGGWLGRVATRYQVSVPMLWEMSTSETLPVLGTAGWILFPPVSDRALQRFAALARLDHDRLKCIQTPSDWITERRYLAYCFRCLVLNDVDVSAPRWKREWLDPEIEFCRVHRTLLETVPASTFRRAGHFEAARRAISRYRETSVFRDYRRLR
ncbi:TniQ family protein [Burkholderia cepacia]|uniref:TniQ family protein n=1 Tax=Burkholderia cepacia TaxID=292 RepID=UPI0039A74EC5